MNSTRTMGKSALMVAGVLGLLAATTGGAQAATRYVAANGIDLGNCGTLVLPCRSISQAIVVAQPGDRIVVGPGRYGDLNRNGTFRGPGDPDGEETVEQNTGCFCMIHVTKPLTLESSGGAAVTVIDGTGAINALRIGASDVVIGRRGRGFTITGAQTGLVATSPVARAHIEDNVFSGNVGSALGMGGDGHTVTGNVAIRNGGGGFTVGGVGSRDNTVTANVASGNQQAGFTLQGSRMRATGNVAGGNVGIGFTVLFESADSVFSGNVAAGNEDMGFKLLSDPGVVGAVTRRNAAIANSRGGFFIGEHGVRVTQSNIFGNGVLPDQGGRFNCGLINPLSIAVLADSNFWGSAVGPDFEPSDEVCDEGTGSTDFTPFATHPFTIVPGAGL